MNVFGDGENVFCEGEARKAEINSAGLYCLKTGH